VTHEVFSQAGVAALSDSLHGILVKFVLLGDLNRLLEALVLSVEKGSDSSAVEELVGLKAASELDGLKAVVFLDAGAEAFEVLILKVDLVESLIDSADVL